MAQRFQRASLLQGMVTPSGGGVRVPTGADPVLQIQAQGFGSLANRLSQFADTANKMAAAKAETKGLAYGARNAPTIEDIEQAKSIGAPVELAGDPGSLNVYQQAAYKGSLAVAASRYEVAGRRKISEEFTSATTDMTLSPTDLRGKFDSIISEYANAFTAVSPTEAGKMQKSLSMLATSNLQSYSRSYATAQIKQGKADALGRAVTRTGDAVSMVNGYQTPINSQSNTASLADQISALRQMTENDLITHNVAESTKKQKLTDFDKAVHTAKVGKLLNFARLPTSSALKLYQGLQDPANKLPPELREIWSSMSAADQQDVYKQAATTLEQQNKFREANERQFDANNPAFKEQAYVELADALDKNNPVAVKKAAHKLAVAGVNVSSILNQTNDVIIFDPPNITEELDRQLAARRLSPKKIFEAKIKSATKADYFLKLRDQQDDLMKKAIGEIKRKYQPDFLTARQQLSAARVKANQQYNAAVDHIEEKLREHRDALGGDASALGELKRFVPRDHLPEAFRKVSEAMTNIELPAAVKALKESYRSRLNFLQTSLQKLPEGQRAGVELPDSLTDENLEDLSAVKNILLNFDRLLPARASAKKDITKLIGQIDVIEQLRTGLTQ
jgi:hypothetical protein